MEIGLCVLMVGLYGVSLYSEVCVDGGTYGVSLYSEVCVNGGTIWES